MDGAQIPKYSYQREADQPPVQLQSIRSLQTGRNDTNPPVK